MSLLLSWSTIYSLVNLVQYQDITTDIFHLILVCSKQKSKYVEPASQLHAASSLKLAGVLRSTIQQLYSPAPLTPSPFP